MLGITTFPRKGMTTARANWWMHLHVGGNDVFHLQIFYTALGYLIVFIIFLLVCFAMVRRLVVDLFVWSQKLLRAEQEHHYPQRASKFQRCCDLFLLISKSESHINADTVAWYEHHGAFAVAMTI